VKEVKTGTRDARYALYRWSGRIRWVATGSGRPLHFKVPLSARRKCAGADPAAGSAGHTYDPATRIVIWTITYSGWPVRSHGPFFTVRRRKEECAPVVWLSKQGARSKARSGAGDPDTEQAEQFTSGICTSTYTARIIPPESFAGRWYRQELRPRHRKVLRRRGAAAQDARSVAPDVQGAAQSSSIA